MSEYDDYKKSLTVREQPRLDKIRQVVQGVIEPRSDIESVLKSSLVDALTIEIVDNRLSSGFLGNDVFPVMLNNLISDHLKDDDLLSNAYAKVTNAAAPKAPTPAATVPKVTPTSAATTPKATTPPTPVATTPKATTPKATTPAPTSTGPVHITLNNVTVLQSIATLMGHDAGPIDGIHGEKTSAGVGSLIASNSVFTPKAGQQLNEDFIANQLQTNPELRAQLIAKAEDILKDPANASPNDIRAVQALVSIGSVKDIAIDGIIGPETRAAFDTFKAVEVAPVPNANPEAIVGAEENLPQPTDIEPKAAVAKIEPAPQPAPVAQTSVDPELVDDMTAAVADYYSERGRVPVRVRIDGVRYDVPEGYEVEEDRDGDFSIKWESGVDFRSDLSAQENVILITPNGQSIIMDRQDLYATLDDMDSKKYWREHFKDASGDDIKIAKTLTKGLQKMVRDGEGGALGNIFGSTAPGSNVMLFDQQEGEQIRIPATLLEKILQESNIPNSPAVSTADPEHQAPLS